MSKYFLEHFDDHVSERIELELRVIHENIQTISPGIHEILAANGGYFLRDRLVENDIESR